MMSSAVAQHPLASFRVSEVGIVSVLRISVSAASACRTLPHHDRHRPVLKL